MSLPSPQPLFPNASREQDLLNWASDAIAAHDVEALRPLLKEIFAGLSANVAAPVLWRCAGQQGNEHVIGLLLVMTQDATSINKRLADLIYEGWTGAATAANVQTLSWLAQHPGTQLNAMRRGKIPLVALENGHEHLAAALLQSAIEKADTPGNKTWPLVGYIQRGCKLGTTKAVLAAIEQGVCGKIIELSSETPTFHSFVTGAAIHGHTDTVLALLEYGAQWLSDEHLAKLLIAAANNDRTDVARILIACGADVLAENSSAVGMAIKSFGRVLAEPGKDYEAHTDGDYFALINALLEAGANPERAMADVGHWVTDPHTADVVKKHIAEKENEVRSSHAARLRPRTPLTHAESSAARAFPLSPLARVGEIRESFFHQAARWRVLSDFVREGLVPFPSREEWESLNARGERLIDLVVASGHTAGMFSPDLWSGRVALVSDVLALVNETLLSESRRVRIIRGARQATLSMARSRLGRRGMQ